VSIGLASALVRLFGGVFQVSVVFHDNQNAFFRKSLLTTPFAALTAMAVLGNQTLYSVIDRESRVSEARLPIIISAPSIMTVPRWRSAKSTIRTIAD